MSKKISLDNSENNEQIQQDFEGNVLLNKIKKLYLQQIYAGIHKINEDGYKNTANIRDDTQ